MRSWLKRGLLFAPDRSQDWSRSHAALPTVLELEAGRRWRVYHAGRDADQRSHVGWFDCDLRSGEVLDAGADPVLVPGPVGHFDDRGIYAASAVREASGRVRLYTIGWNLGPPPLFYASIGIAVSDDGGATFTQGRAPLVARSVHDPWMVSAPFVLHEGSDGRWRMWYLSGQGWDTGGSHYDVKHAWSHDGLAWERDGRIVIGGERNVSRACVLPGAPWRAWFAADAGAGYRIGYAESPDGLDWERVAETVPVAPSGEAGAWDEHAVAYPYVVDLGDRLVMLHNGDGFGRDGIGWAEAERGR